MEIIVQMQSTVAAEMRKSKPRDSIVGAVKEIIEEFGVELRPLHPTVKDETLQTYFVIITSDKEIGDEITKRLRHCESVDAAYVKPFSEEPNQINRGLHNG